MKTAVVGAGGAERVLHPPLAPGEPQGPQDSARAPREAAAPVHR